MSEDDVRDSEERQEKTRNRLANQYGVTGSDTSDTSDAEDSSDSGGTESTKDTADSSDTSDMTPTTDTADTSDTAEIADTDVESRNTWMGDPPLQDRKDMNFYLPEEVHEELLAAFAELNAEYRREHGEDLEKHKQYLPHLLMAALEDDMDAVRDRLNL